MKKSLSLFLALVMVLALGVTAFANPYVRPNINPGASEVTIDGVRVNVVGGGANLRFYVGGVEQEDRAGQGTFVHPVTINGVAYLVHVQGNSIVGVTLAITEPITPDPYVVSSGSFRQFVRYEQIDSYFYDTSEVEGSREFVNGSAAMYNWVRGNQNNAAFAAYRGQFTGQAVLTGARVTGTLNYEYVRNYVEQFERVYVWVDYVIWSDERGRIETVQPDSEHVYGDVVDGDAYYTGPYASSRAIDVTTPGRVLLHMGHGQSSRWGRTAVGGLGLSFELHNTGNPPRMTITITDIDVDAL